MNAPAMDGLPELPFRDISCTDHPFIASGEGRVPYITSPSNIQITSGHARHRIIFRLAALLETTIEIKVALSNISHNLPHHGSSMPEMQPHCRVRTDSKAEKSNPPPGHDRLGKRCSEKLLLYAHPPSSSTPKPNMDNRRLMSKRLRATHRVRNPSQLLRPYPRQGQSTIALGNANMSSSAPLY